MCKIVRKQAGQLVDGERIQTLDETLWGWREMLHRVVAPQCELDTRLVKFEVRDGPSLQYVIRAEQDWEYSICA